MNDRPILNWMLHALEKNGIADVVFVAGFHQGMLRDYVRDNHPSIRATWVENPVFDQTNTAYSLWLARKQMLSGGDMILINGDVVLDHRAIQTTLEAEGSNVLATRFDRCGAEEVKVRLDGDRRITEIGKHLAPGEAAGESVGINRISQELLPHLFDTIQERIDNGNGRKEFYEHAFNALIQDGIDFRTADVTKLPVMEVDTPEDYEDVTRTIASRLEG